MTSSNSFISWPGNINRFNIKRGTEQTSAFVRPIRTPLNSLSRAALPCSQQVLYDAAVCAHRRETETSLRAEVSGGNDPQDPVDTSQQSLSACIWLLLGHDLRKQSGGIWHSQTEMKLPTGWVSEQPWARWMRMHGLVSTEAGRLPTPRQGRADTQLQG